MSLLGRCLRRPQHFACIGILDSLYFRHLWGALHEFEWGHMNKTPLTVAAQAVMREHFGTPPDTHDVGAAVERVYATLLTNLSFFLGEIGSFALIRRSLRLSEGVFPCLATLRDTAHDGLVSALGRCFDEHPPDAPKDVSIAVLASSFELLATLIGLGLTLHIVQGTWPDVRLSVTRRAENE